MSFFLGHTKRLYTISWQNSEIVYKHNSYEGNNSNHTKLLCSLHKLDKMYVNKLTAQLV